MSDMRGIAGPNHKDRRGTSEVGSLAATRAAARPALLLQQVGVLCEHPRPAQAPTASVCELSQVDRPCHVGVAMTEEKRDLVNALARQECSACDGLPEAMH